MKMKALIVPTLTILTLVSSLMTTKAADSKLADGVYAEFQTSKGKIVCQLEYEKTPLTVANFVGLAEGTKNYSTDGSAPKKQDKPFYDGLTFHRVIAGFMIQGGCPQGRGTGGPGYKFKDECLPELKHAGPGILSMANSGPGSNGSQFFITHVPTPHLDGKHTVFGETSQGQDVIDAIRQGDKIVSIEILDDAEPVFTAQAANITAWNKILDRGK